MNKIKTLFAHDVPLIKNTVDSKYYTITFSYKLWQRYLEFSEELIVATRNQEKEIPNINDYLISSGPNVSFLGIPSLSSIKTRYINLITAKWKLNIQLDEVNAVVVRLPSSIGHLTYNLAKKKGIPTAVEMVGCPYDSLYHHGSIKGKIYSFYAKWKYSSLLKDATHVLYVTEDFLQKRYPTNGYTTNASNVVLRDHSELISKKKLESISINNNEIKIGIVGSLDVMYKGLDTAIRAIENIRERNNEIKIVLEVVGGGDKEKWINYAKKFNCLNSIYFVGQLQSSQVYNWLEEIDIYIQPSKTEGLPRTLIEAMSVGCPCIGSNVGGIPELLEKEYMHNPDDYMHLSNLIIKLILDKDARIIQSIHNFKKSKEYSQEILDNKRSEFYQTFFDNVKYGRGDSENV